MTGKATIERYGFGRIVINGREYASDLFIFPDGRVRDRWWRASGHRLSLGDLEELLAARPTIIVCGTGAAGMMVPDPELGGLLGARGVAEFLVRPTPQAVQLFNRLSAEGRRPAACLHLTC